MRSKSPPKSTQTPAAASPSEASNGHDGNHPAASFTKILVPIDFSEGSLRALDYAIAMADQFKASLILLHVVEPTLYPGGYLALASAIGDDSQHLIKIGNERLDALRRKKLGTRREVELVVRMGRAASEIPDTARALAADLVIIAAHRQFSPRPVLMGSTAEKVVRQAYCPVLVVNR